MIKLLTKLPKEITIAFSGGVDSVAITDFLKRKHNVSLAYFHHGTEHSDKALDFVDKYAEDNDLSLYIGILRDKKPKGLSSEEFWRMKRYEFLEGLDCQIVTAHHLNDCVETYIWSALHGKPKVIPVTRNNIVRPFLTTPKNEFINWCERKGLKWCEDESNKNNRYTRNYIRNKLLPHALHVNPGLATTVKKIIEKNLGSNLAQNI